MQAATDAAALILSKEAQSLNAAQLKAKALTYFMANFNRPDVTNIVVTPTFTQPATGNFTLNLVSSGDIKTTLTGIWQPTLSIGANSQVMWGMKKLELALALDNTGSMASAQQDDEPEDGVEKPARDAKNAAKKDGDVKVAIIPFDTTVNLGTSYKDNDWFDIDSIDCNGWKKGNGCNKNNWKDHWEGCVRDRTYPNDGTDATPDKNKKDTLFPVYDCGSLANADAADDQLDGLERQGRQMSPNGNTNVTIGLAWGWHALTAERAAVGSRRAGDRSRQGAHHPDRRHQHRDRGKTPTTPRSRLRRRSTTAPSSPAPTSRRRISRSTRSA